MILLLIPSIFALNVHYSPVVTGQYIVGQFSSGSVYEDLILSSPDVARNRVSFTSCQFVGSGDNDYRYGSTDDKDIVYLTDDDYINAFDEYCRLLDSHAVNGTLNSQPFIMDYDIDYNSDLYYLSRIGSDNYINRITYVDGQFTNHVNYKVGNTNDQCYGMYCDSGSPSVSNNKCGVLCKTSGGAELVYIFDGDTNTYDTAILSITIATMTYYDESNDIYKFETGTSDVFIEDRAFPALYGMDIDRDGHTELVAWGMQDVDSISLSIVDMITGNEILGRDNFYDFPSMSGHRNISGSAGILQPANIGNFNGEGNIFLSAVTSKYKAIARVFNSQANTIKTLYELNGDSDESSLQLSNFAVADIDRDLINDYCIAFNETTADNRTRIRCYSGGGSLLTNCTVSEWGTNNPITLSLLEWDTTTDKFNAITPMGIYGLEEDDGGSCGLLYDFDNIDSASEGALLPVDITADGSPDLIYYGADGGYLFSTGVTLPTSGDYTTICGYDHIMFCDNFDYSFPMYNRQWEIIESDSEINATFTPRNNELNISDTEKRAIEFGHSVDSTLDSTYRISEDVTYVRAYQHPVVSHQFGLTPRNNSGTLLYIVYDSSNRVALQVAFNATNVFIGNTSSPTYYTKICDGCLIKDSSNAIKIIQYFGKDTENALNIKFPFNTSFDNSEFDIIINGITRTKGAPFENIQASRVGFIEFNKRSSIFDDSQVSGSLNTYNFTGEIDNLYVYRGTARSLDTSYKYYDDLYIPVNESSGLTEEQEQKDWYSQLGDGFDDIGIISTGSKLFFALLLMVMTAVLVTKGLGEVGITGMITGVIVLLLLFFEIVFFTYLGFIPLWVIFILLMLSAGIGWFIYKSTNDG